MRRTRISFASIGLLVGLFIFGSYGQTPAPKVGYLRFWDMLPVANGAFELCKVGASASEGNLLSNIAYQYSSYAEFPAGTYQLAVYKKGDRNSPIKTFNLNLKPDSFFTILLLPQSGVISAELIDDTNDPKATSGILTVRNYFSGLTVAVASDTQKIVDTLPYGQTYAAAGLPLQRVPLTLRTRLPNGTSAESTAEADFKASKRATVLIIPDSYGRFRPRVTIDGKN